MRIAMVFIGLLVSITGCTTCHHRAGDIALESEHCAESQVSQRSRVYVVLVKGLDPIDLAGMDSLRQGLIECGYPKVYRLEIQHLPFFKHELARVAADQPNARFIVVGAGTGCLAARSLAGHLARSGCCVDSLMEIAPNLTANLAPESDCEQLKTIVLSRVNVGSHPSGPNTEFRLIPDLHRLTPCKHPLVLEMLKNEARESSFRVDDSEIMPFPTLPILDFPAPMPGLIHGIPEKENSKFSITG